MILPKAAKINFSIFFKVYIEKSIHQNQDLAKSWKKQFFNTILIRIWIEKKAFTKTKILPKAAKINFSILFWLMNRKSIHQNQDLAKSCKGQFFNTVLIRIWIEKSIRQNQDLAKSWKSIFQYFFN